MVSADNPKPFPVPVPSASFQSKSLQQFALMSKRLLTQEGFTCFGVLPGFLGCFQAVLYFSVEASSIYCQNKSFALMKFLFVSFIYLSMFSTMTVNHLFQTKLYMKTYNFYNKNIHLYRSCDFTIRNM